MSSDKGKSNNRLPKPPSAKTLLDAVPDMLFRVSRDGRFLDYKPADGLEPFRPPEEFLGRKIVDVLPKDVASDILSLIDQAIESGETQTHTYQLKLDDGIHTYEGRVVRLGTHEALMIVRDLTARIRNYNLTPREAVVLKLVAAGITDKEVAERIDLSADTVHKHVASILKKMGVSSRTEASMTALRNGLVK